MITRMKELNSILRKASKAYYEDGKEIMSNYEYDRLYDELEQLEKETGIILADSMTQTVGYEVMSDLPKKKHPVRMLSLDKTKDREELVKWLNHKKGCLSWKCDGLTVVLTYKNGMLQEAVTRGNGTIGEVITPNAKHFHGIPLKIPFNGELILRGEALMTYENFEKVNAQIGDADAKYKNPRNLASGTIRQLDTKVTAERGIDFYAFTLVSAENFSENSYAKQLDWLETLGFQVVEHQIVTEEELKNVISQWEDRITSNSFPSDGLVLFYDDVAYGESLGTTAKFPRNGMAFKWKDDTEETTLREIEWSASRTGLLNPVAVFDTVELEGTSVSRASVHNVSVIEDFQLKPGDTIEVFKANKIIPQIASNHTKGLKDISEVLPRACPVCGGAVRIEQMNESKVLICTNEDCLAKRVGKFEHFVSRDAMNLVGVSTAVILTLINLHALEKFSDFYHLEEYKNEIIQVEGMGEKSYEKMIDAIEKSRTTELYRFLYALGISGVGVETAKLIANHFDQSLDEIRNAESPEEFMEIEGIGSVVAGNIYDYFGDSKKEAESDLLAKELTFVHQEKTSDRFSGMSFVITGSVHTFKNRKELKEWIENQGGKVTSAISASTNYLINNDANSTSSKNRKAKELGISILTEEELRNL